MNWATLLLLSGVFVLGGCLQKESPQSRPLKDAATSPDSSKTQSPQPATAQAAATTADGVKIEFSSAGAQTRLPNWQPSKVGPASSASSAPAVNPTGDADDDGSMDDDFGDDDAPPMSGTPAVPAKGPSDATGATAPPASPEAPAATAPNSEIVPGNRFDVLNSEAYTKIITPLIQKIRAAHPPTADLFEAGFQQTVFETTEMPLAEAAKAEDANLVVPAYKAPGGNDYQVLQLSTHVLLSAHFFAATTADKQAPILLEAVLLRLALSVTTENDGNALLKVAGLEHILAETMLKTKDRMNAGLLYQYLAYGKLSTEGWDFDTVTTTQAASELLRLNGRRLNLVTATPGDAFTIRNVNPNANSKSATDKTARDSCKIAVEYRGLDKGLHIKVSEPVWNDFEVAFAIDNKVSQEYALKDSLAGDKYLDLELLSAKDETTSNRFTLRYAKNPSGELSLDYVVFDQLPTAGGRATKLVMCRVLPAE